MRAIRAASAALLAVSALVLTAPTATAAVDGGNAPFGFTVTPSTVAAGGRVTLSVTNCGTTATASSGVFDTVNIASGRSATATVDWDAKAGATYQVTFTCNGQSGKTSLRISGATRNPTPAPTATRTTAATVVPGGVRGGLGGSIGGINTTELVAGTALVVAAATGTIYAVRRRAEGRKH
ncbi:hypothetical protein CU044_2444 [Streptomyces sp. L-9-10]|uniref:hypothetical protein n=1 Tax=unclassified Streptomyces TaxID=2593676 RepID=UPI00101D5B3F|nr:hypothetical protein [Streptomyces sp. L-9-10]RYJ29351.1 hypothetical protein CU044_2444 [Streptomyces sp. L-9-10]